MASVLARLDQVLGDELSGCDATRLRELTELASAGQGLLDGLLARIAVALGAK